MEVAIHHRGTESTEITQRVKLYSILRASSVSSVSAVVSLWCNAYSIMHTEQLQKNVT